MTRYAVTLNGRISTELKPRQGRSVDEELAARLALLDGKERFSLLLWRLPEGVPFDQVDLDAGPIEYIQCAGGASGGFTCEVRHLDAEGKPRQEVVGRAVTHGVPVSDAAVSWAQNETIVHGNEVLSLADVEELFTSYRAAGDIPVGYERRVLAL